MFWIEATNNPGEQYKKIKSRGSTVFIINEFIIERILFFGNKYQASKTVKSKKNCIGINLIAVLRIYRKDEDEVIEINSYEC